MITHAHPNPGLRGLGLRGGCMSPHEGTCVFIPGTYPWGLYGGAINKDRVKIRHRGHLNRPGAIEQRELSVPTLHSMNMVLKACGYHYKVGYCGSGGYVKSPKVAGFN